MNNLEIAYYDIYTANLLITTGNDEGRLRIAAYHVQQALEKTLKLILDVNRVRYEYKHDMRELITKVNRLGVVIPNNIINISVVVSYWQSQSRYKGSFRTNYNDVAQSMNEVKSFMDNVAFQFNMDIPNI